MKKALKELIENASVKKSGEFINLLVVSNGVYDGFWGKNGYCNIMLFGKEEPDGEWYKISECADKLNIWPNSFDDNSIFQQPFNLDIPAEYGVPRLWFSNPIRIDYDDISDIVGYYTKKESEELK